MHKRILAAVMAVVLMCGSIDTSLLVYATNAGDGVLEVEETSMDEDGETEKEGELETEEKIEAETESETGTETPEEAEPTGESQAEEEQPKEGQTDAVIEESVQAEVIIEEAVQAEEKISSFNTSTDTEYAEITWNLDEDGVLTIGGTGAMEDYTSTTMPWYDVRDSILAVVIEDGITCVGKYAFLWCSNLKNVALSDTVVSIHEYAFEGCSSLVSIKLPETLLDIENGAFIDCSSLAEITLPDSTTSLGYRIFSGCTELLSVNYPLNLASINWYGSSSIGGPHWGPFGNSNIETIVMPSGVTELPGYVFSGCEKLANISLPDSLISIGIFAFQNCSNLEELKLPDSITTLGYKIFDGCTALTAINYPFNLNSCSYLSDGGPFGGSSIGTVTIPSGVTVIPRGAFNGCDNLINVELPDSLTSIDDNVFYNCTSITHLELPDSLVNIGDYAFYGCNNLTSLTLPDSVESLGYKIFEGCTELTSINYPFNLNSVSRKNFVGPFGDSNIEKIIMPDGVTKIPEYTFCGCTSLIDISLPDTLTEIGDRAFYGCSGLAELKLPDNIVTLGYQIFCNCTSLKSINYPLGLTGGWQSSFSGPFADSSIETVIFTEGVQEILDYTFYSCTCLKNIELPTSVTTIGEYAFAECPALESVELPDGLVSIEESAFSFCSSLTGLSLPDSITLLGRDVFSYCTALTSINYPLNLTSAYCAFRDSLIETVSVPYGVVNIPEGTFYGCSCLSNIELPASLTTIEERAFADCTSLSNLTLPDSISSMGSCIFEDCAKLASINYPQSLSGGWSSSSSPFASSSIESVTIPDGVQTLPDYVFRNCDSLKIIIIPDSVVSIGDGVFWSCTELEELTLSDSLTSVGNYAFYECTSLAALKLPDSISTIGYSMFYGCLNLTSINYPLKLSLSNYYVSSGYYFGPFYGSAIESVTVPEGTTEIPDYTFSSATSLQQIALPETLTHIGIRVFYNCASLRELELPASLVSIDDYAFYDCASLESLVLPDSIATLGCGILEYCVNLESITIPEGLASIPEYTFRGCTSLTNLKLPDSLTEIGSWAFSGCSSISNLVLPNNIETLGGGIVSGCSVLTEVNYPLNLKSSGNSRYDGPFAGSSIEKISIPVGVTEIPDYTFSNCTSLQYMVLPNTLTIIGNYACYGCTSITYIELPVTLTEVGSSAFYNCTALTDVYYAGTQDDWNAITINDGNTCLTSATIHFENEDAPSLNGTFGAWITSISSSAVVIDGVRYETSGDLLSDESSEAYLGAALVTMKNGVITDIALLNTCTGVLESYDSGTGSVVIDGEEYATASLSANSLQSIRTSIGTAIAYGMSGDVIYVIGSEDSVVSSDGAVTFGAQTQYTIYTGDELTIMATVSGISGLEADDFTWTIEDETIVTEVYTTALVTGELSSVFLTVAGTGNSGTTTITLSVPDGQSARCTVTAAGEKPEEENTNYNVESSITDAESLLNRYWTKWNKAYTNYVDTVEDTLYEDASSGTDRTEVIYSMKATMREADEAAGNGEKYISGVFEDDVVKDAAYEALSIFLYDSINSCSDFDLSSITAADINGAKLVNSVKNSIGKIAEEYSIGNVTVNISGFCYTNAYSAMMTCKKKGDSQYSNYAICSSSSNMEKILRSYMLELLDFETSAVYEVYSAFCKDITGSSLDKLTQQYLNDKLEEYTSSFLSSGVGDLIEDLHDCYQYYQYAKKIVSWSDSDMTPENLLSEMQGIEFEDTSITNSAVKKAWRLLKNAGSELNYAYMSYLAGTLDESKIGTWWNNTVNWFSDQIASLKATFKCPINISVYDAEGTLIGYVGDDDIWYMEGLVYITEEGDAKIIYSFLDEPISFEVEATDYGTLDCSIEAYDEEGQPSGRTNFYDIELYSNQLLTVESTEESQSVNESYTITTDGEQLAADESIAPDKDASVSVSCYASVGGSVDGAGKYVRGDAVALLATPEDGYYFMGWYQDETLVSVSELYGFVAREDVRITAVFVSNNVDGTDKTTVLFSGITAENKVYDSLPYTYSGTAIVTSTEDDTDLTDIVTLTKSYTGTLADGTVYDETGQPPTDAGTYILTVAVSEDDENYTGSQEYSFEITQAVLTISADDLNLCYEDSVPETYGYSVEGFLGSDVLITEPSFLCDVTDMSQSAQYTITPYGANAGVNYEISYVSGTLTVTEDRVEYTIKNIPDQVYTGSAVKPEPTVLDGTKILVKGKDYTLTYKNNTKVGTATITVKGKGNYTDTVSVSFEIVKKDISDTSAVTATAADKATTATVVDAEGKLLTKWYSYPKVKYGKLTLKRGTDYTVDGFTLAQEDTTGAYIVTVSLSGKGNYTGTREVTYRIATKNISGVVTGTVAAQTYTGSALEPEVVVYASSAMKKAGTALTEDTDYTVEYANNTAVGTGKIILTGIGAYSGTKTITFKINKKGLAVPKSGDEITVQLSADGETWLSPEDYSAIYTGAAQKPQVQVVYQPSESSDDTAVTLTEGTDYKLSWKNNVNAVQSTTKSSSYPTVTITGRGSYSGSRSVSFTITPLTLTTDNTQITAADVKYTSTVKKSGAKPTLTVKVMLGEENTLTTLKKGTAYTVTSYENNTSIGDAKVFIAGKGNYTTSEDLAASFRIYESAASGFYVTVTAPEGNSSMTYTGREIEPTITVYKNKTDQKNKNQRVDGRDRLQHFLCK